MSASTSDPRSISIQLSAPFGWHAGALAAAATWPAPLALRLSNPDLSTRSSRDDANGNGRVPTITAVAVDAAPPAASSVIPADGHVQATVVGRQPMSAGRFTAWAQRTVLGLPVELVGPVASWLPGNLVEVHDLSTDARASHRARTVLRSAAAGLACVDDVLLATSELTANALQHASGAASLMTSRTPDSMLVGVTDWHPEITPTVLHLGSAAPSGRGMAIVDAIASHWGISVFADRKVVWCEFAVTTARE